MKSLDKMPANPTREEQQRTFDTSHWGFSNLGHNFGDALTNDQRSEVIEYLKTL